MMQEYLFIGQYDFVDYFSRRGSERWKKFSALCGTKSYEKRYEDFSKLLGVDRSGYERSNVSVAFLQDSIKEAEDGLERIGSELDRVLAKKTEIARSVSLEELLFEQETARKKLQSIERLKAILEHLAREKVTLQTSLARIESSCRESENRIKEAEHDKLYFNMEISKVRAELDEILSGTSYEKESARLAEIVKSNTRRELLEKEIFKTQSRLNGLEKPVALEMNKNLKLRDEFDNLMRRIGNFESDLMTIRSLADVLNGLRMADVNVEPTCCLLCGAEPDHWRRDLSNLEQASENLRNELETCRSEYTNLKNRLDEYERTEKRNESILAERKEVSDQLERFSAELRTYPEYDPQAAMKLDRLNEKSRRVRETQIRLKNEDKTIDVETESRDKHHKEGDILRNDIQKIEQETDRILAESIELDPDNLDSIRAEIRARESRIESIRECEKQIAELEGQKAESERQADRFRKQFEEQCRMRENFGDANLWFDKCGRALRWLHKDGLPRLIHASVLKDLARVVNDELRRYDDPFTVTVNEDLTFRVHFPDGTRGNSTSISGGQRYLLVLSFLMAMNRTFAQNLGIMFLDEPTAFLDEENVMFLLKILEQLKRTLRSRGRQLVVVTHVEALATIADTVYSLAHIRQSPTGTDRTARQARLLPSI